MISSSSRFSRTVRVVRHHRPPSQNAKLGMNLRTARLRFAVGLLANVGGFLQLLSGIIQSALSPTAQVLPLRDRSIEPVPDRAGNLIAGLSTRFWRQQYPKPDSNS